MKKAVLAADLHLREDQPTCWTADYWTEQEKKVRFIRELCGEHDCPLYVAGDVFHHWKPSPRLIAWAIANLPRNTWFIPGQHDLPNHSLDQFDRSGCAVLSCFFHSVRCVQENVGQHFSIKGEVSSDVLLLHRLVWQDTPPFPVENYSGRVMELPERDQYRLIVSGDNHTSFHEIFENGNMLVNPGSLMRMTAAQQDHKPSVYLATESGVSCFTLPEDPPGAVSREHLLRQEEHDERVTEFVSRLASSNALLSLDFRQNVLDTMERLGTLDGVRRKVLEMMGD